MDKIVAVEYRLIYPTMVDARNSNDNHEVKDFGNDKEAALNYRDSIQRNVNTNYLSTDYAKGAVKMEVRVTVQIASDWENWTNQEKDFLDD